MTEPAPFRLDVSDDDLADLHARLDRTRIPTAVHDCEWDYGMEPGFHARLIEYWRIAYDWRVAEARLNQMPQFTAPVQDMTLHFVHQRGRGPAPIPLLFSHGWPGSFYEVSKIIGPLTDPAAHGGDPADAFDVVAPSLPGYGFSPDPQIRGVDPVVIGDRFTTLMTDVLGYERFGLQGGDWGGMITTAAARRHPEQVIGLHLNSPGATPHLDESTPPLTEAEQTMIGDFQQWMTTETGYQAIHRTKPQTLAYSLIDSPSGLAAWIAEKFQSWTHHDGDMFEAVSRDDLLTNIMIYWWSGSIGSSARLYYEAMQGGVLLPPLDPGEKITVPTGYAAFPGEIILAPREWVERAYNVTTYHRFERGGHFAALERPDDLVRSIREHFRPLRRVSPDAHA